MGCGVISKEFCLSGKRLALSSGQADRDRRIVKDGISTSTHNDDGEKIIDKIGLTKRQMFILRTSWRTISNEMTIHGLTIFVDMFKSHREVHDAFPRLNPVLAQHYTGR